MANVAMPAFRVNIFAADGNVFSDSAGTEIVKILRDVAQRLENGEHTLSIDPHTRLTVTTWAG